jgi:hypothetical protein
MGGITQPNRCRRERSNRFTNACGQSPNKSRPCRPKFHVVPSAYLTPLPRLAQIGCRKVFLYFSVHTSCTRRLEEIEKLKLSLQSTMDISMVYAAFSRE